MKGSHSEALTNLRAKLFFSWLFEVWEHLPVYNISQFCFWQYILSLHNPFTSHALLNTSTTWAACLIRLPAQLFDLCATKFPVLFSNEKCWAGESQWLIIFLLLEFMWCIWGQLPPFCATAFLSAQCELSQREEECMPGRLLPPHQICPLPLLSLRLSFTMIHTQRESSSCLFFFCLFFLHSFWLSLLKTPTPSCSQVLNVFTYASVWTHVKCISSFCYCSQNVPL